MNQVISKDGTKIAFDRVGSGDPIVLVDGALSFRASGPNSALAELLAERFTVFTYDRRGRGASDDTAPYAVEREVEDIEALIAEAGGSAHLYGISSGGALALDAANRLTVVRKLALYEVPFVVDDSRPPLAADFAAHLTDLIAADRRTDAVRYFLRAVEVPAFVVAMMRLMPVWKTLKSVAHTLPYDARILGEDTIVGRPLPTDRWTSVTAPTLVIAGGRSPEWMRNSAAALAQLLGAGNRILEGQTHLVKAKALAPVVAEFFATSPRTERAAQEVPTA